MKKRCVLLILVVIFSCKKKKPEVLDEKEKFVQAQIIKNEFQRIIDTANVAGAILVYDLNTEVYYSNDFQWSKKGFLPASTFKIPNSMIALETKVVENDSTLCRWDGAQRGMDIWEQDLTFKEAFHFSCVPCYQDIARKIGAKRMNAYLKKFDYGNMKVDATSISMFWLEGESQISPLQQIDFLKRFYKSELPISKRTTSIMKRMMLLEETDSYTLRGKTGWSIRNGNNNGWFVGYVESNNSVYFFATNIIPNEIFNMSQFPSIRKEITYKALRNMNFIN